VNTESPQGGWSGGGEREFRFEPSWVEEENCGVLVENAWKTSVEARGENVGEALKRVASALGDWGRNVLGSLEKSMKRAKKALEECRRRAISDASVRREELLKLKLEKLEEKKNLYWRQRAKVHWLEKGDRNTKFFHHYASERKKKSRINRLVKENGEEVVEEAGIRNMITDFYKALFTATNSPRQDELLPHTPLRVTPEMNEALLKPFTAEEVKAGLDAIGDLKAPGADGMASFIRITGPRWGRM